jgi:hypothetical protein
MRYTLTLVSLLLALPAFGGICVDEQGRKIISDTRCNQDVKREPVPRVSEGMPTEALIEACVDKYRGSLNDPLLYRTLLPSHCEMSD